MRYTFTIDEVRQVQAICRDCEKVSEGGYCKMCHTDSIVFKVEKCEKLKELKNEETNS